jgi:hypothetical protein
MCPPFFAIDFFAFCGQQGSPLPEKWAGRGRTPIGRIGFYFLHSLTDLETSFLFLRTLHLTVSVFVHTIEVVNGCAEGARFSG